MTEIQSQMATLARAAILRRSLRARLVSTTAEPRVSVTRHCWRCNKARSATKARTATPDITSEGDRVPHINHDPCAWWSARRYNQHVLKIRSVTNHNRCSVPNQTPQRSPCGLSSLYYESISQLLVLGKRCTFTGRCVAWPLSFICSISSFKPVVPVTDHFPGGSRSFLSE